MKDYKRLAAIDIGSNGVRLLINTIYQKEEETQINKTILVRLPIRLGEDAFLEQTIRPKNITRMIKGMQSYSLLMEVYEVDGYLAYATSAMREALNGEEVVKEIKETTGIDIKIIDGKKEANVIFSTNLKRFLNDEYNYLYVDVGGGSTEITLLEHNAISDSQSFPIGTVRLLENKVSKSEFKEMKNWVSSICEGKKLALIGSGGNINFIFKKSGLGMDEPMKLSYLIDRYKEFKALSVEDRMFLYDMKPDRADVVVPALEIYTKVMKWSGGKKIIVPKIGLADVMIQYMYQNQ